MPWNRARLEIQRWELGRKFYYYYLLEGVPWVGFRILVQSIAGWKIFFMSSFCLPGDGAIVTLERPLILYSIKKKVERGEIPAS